MNVKIFYENGKGTLIKTLQQERFFVDENCFKVPEGFISDGASIPRFLWSLISPCIEGRSIRAAVVHDYLYHSKIFSRKKADKIFLDLLIAEGFPVVKSWCYYLAVRLFGGRFY